MCAPSSPRDRSISRSDLPGSGSGRSHQREKLRESKSFRGAFPFIKAAASQAGRCAGRLLPGRIHRGSGRWPRRRKAARFKRERSAKRAVANAVKRRVGRIISHPFWKFAGADGVRPSAQQAAMEQPALGSFPPGLREQGPKAPDGNAAGNAPGPPVTSPAFQIHAGAKSRPAGRRCPKAPLL